MRAVDCPRLILAIALLTSLALTGVTSVPTVGMSPPKGGSAKSSGKSATQTANAKNNSSDDLFNALVDKGNKAYAAQKYDLAEASYKSALNIFNGQQGVLALLNRAAIYSNLGTVYFAQKKFPEAEAAYKQSIDLQEKLLVGHHAVVSDTLLHYSALLRRMNRMDEAGRVETQAEMLKVDSLSGKDYDFKFERGDQWSAKAAQSSPSFSIDTAARPDDASPKAPTFRVNRIVKMSQQDRSLMDNPTTTERPVYRDEVSYEGGIIDPATATVVGATVKHRQVLDHYEKVAISSAQDLSYVSPVADLQTRYQLSQSKVREVLDAINSGGSAVELSNGWLMVTNEDLNSTHWYSGLEVSTGTRNTESATYMVRTADKRYEFVAKRIAVLNV